VTSRHSRARTGTATLRLAGGRIAEIWDNVDLLAVLQQIGAVPPVGHTGETIAPRTT